MKALIDTNVILDHLLNRIPFFDPASQVWQACARGQFAGYISPITPLNVFYITRKLVSPSQAREGIDKVLLLFDICPLDRTGLQTALHLPVNDYEDAVQYVSALSAGIDVIVTRDPQGYIGLPITVLSPQSFLKTLPAAME